MHRSYRAAPTNDRARAYVKYTFVLQRVFFDMELAQGIGDMRLRVLPDDKQTMRPAPD